MKGDDDAEPNKVPSLYNKTDQSLRVENTFETVNNFLNTP